MAPSPPTARRFAILAIAAALGLTFLAGMLAERVRYDRNRSAVLERLELARRAYHQRLMEIDRAGEGLAARPERARGSEP